MQHHNTAIPAICVYNFKVHRIIEEGFYALTLVVNTKILIQYMTNDAHLKG
jgi:hypothetical protein